MSVIFNVSFNISLILDEVFKIDFSTFDSNGKDIVSRDNDNGIFCPRVPSPFFISEPGG